MIINLEVKAPHEKGDDYVKKHLKITSRIIRVD